MEALSTPIIDATNAGAIERFRFWIAGESPPAAAESVVTEGGAVINALPPGYWECAMVSNVVPGMWGIFYWLQAGPRNYIILSCFDHFFDGIEEVMNDTTRGESATTMLRTIWPVFSKLRDAGLRGDLTDGCLTRIRTTNDLQWCVSLHTGGFELTRLEQFYEGESGQAFGKLQQLTIDLMAETYKGPLAAFGDEDELLKLAKSVRSHERWKRVEKSMNDVLEIVDTFGKHVGA